MVVNLKEERARGVSLVAQHLHEPSSPSAGFPNGRPCAAPSGCSDLPGGFAEAPSADTFRRNNEPARAATSRTLAVREPTQHTHSPWRKKQVFLTVTDFGE